MCFFPFSSGFCAFSGFRVIFIKVVVVIPSPPSPKKSYLYCIEVLSSFPGLS